MFRIIYLTQNTNATNCMRMYLTIRCVFFTFSNFEKRVKNLPFQPFATPSVLPVPACPPEPWRRRKAREGVSPTAGRTSASGYRGGCSAYASRLALIGGVRHLSKQALCIHHVPQFFPNFCPAFSFCGTQKGKANIKSFGKGWGVQGGRKKPFSKGFSFPPPAGLRNKAM